MSALSEASFLLDISRWAVQGHMDFVGEMNNAIEELQQHNQQVVKTHEENDRVGANNTAAPGNSLSV